MRTRLLAALFVAAVVLIPISVAQDTKKPKLNPFRKAEPTMAKVKEFNDKPTQEQVAFFEKKIRPVLIDSCYACHDSDKPDKIKGGLTLNSREGLRTGGDNGPAILAGDANRSLLIKAIRYTDDKMQMPPKKKLSDQQIADFETWVAMGAPDPRGDTSKLTVKTEIDIEKGKQFWAYQVPKSTLIPSVTNKEWPRSDTDRIILAALEAKNLKPVADADSRALVRRIHLDLIGLPPTSEVAEKFVFDYDRDPQKALEAIIDTLLASPQYGERWGRHWLDVARYAETTGKAVNFNYPNAWRYRDYVIDRFNRDTPFTTFVKEQLAGDLLPTKDDKEKAKNIIATGFLQIGSKNLGERNKLQFELDVADEQIDTVTQAFLGTTAACARCHDHKFDPIPTKDYYALVGIFRSTDNCYGTIRFVQANQPSNLISLPQGSAPTVLSPLSASERKALEKQIADTKEAMAAETDRQKNIFRFATLSIAQAKLELYEKDGTPKVQAMGCRDKYIGRDSPVYARGEPEKAGDTVPRGVLQVVGGPKVNITKKSSGRLQLAEWIASEQNPLTARVYVNRVWLHLFGRGIVASPDNFGTTGIAPSNLALLDHLAIQFTKEGWSTKKLIRSIMLSHAYQLSTKFDVNNHNADPDNDLVWRMSPQRLDAEAVRDSILAVSGALNTKAPVGSVMAQTGDGPTTRPGLRTNVRVDNDNTHRSVYMPIIRDNLPEVMSLFDMADPNMVVGDRPSTSVPAQSLFLMNNPFVITNSEKAADKILASGTSDTARIRTAYLTFFGRVPTDKELATAEKFLTEYPASSRRNLKKEPWVALCQAMFGSAEFLMRN
ncbi:PSD1 and planctomycete cytochrome C domain-containing protein [soil metagenome]